MPWLFDRPTPALVAASDALPGRAEPILADPPPHAVLGTTLTGPWAPGQATILLGMGCFWGAEKLLWNLPGVLSTSVGYAGGITPNPTYQEVCTGATNHAEVVRVVYDPQRISLEELVATAWEAHDPTQGFRQGADVGTQYRSVIFTVGPDAQEDARRAQQVVDAYAAALAQAGYPAVTTRVGQLADTPAGEFYLAEEDHQQYLHKVPQGYCPEHSTGVACPRP